jgi:hypothetical protein
MGGPYSKLLKLKTLLILHTTLINAAYEEILGQYKGSYIPPKPPSWVDPSLFWLDDYMPYEVKTLKGCTKKKLESFQMITGTTLSNWLSPALTGAYLLAPSSSVRAMVQLAAMAVRQNSFEHYYLVTQEMLKIQSLRLCFLEDKYRQKVDLLLVDELMSLIDSVNAIEDNGSLELLCRSTVEPYLNATSARIREILPGCELCPFRLLVFLQWCAHLNVGTTACKNLRNLLYPVFGAVSHCHIVANGFHDSQVDEICSILQSKMSTPSRVVFMDQIESCCVRQVPITDGGKDTISSSRASIFSDWMNMELLLG